MREILRFFLVAVVVGVILYFLDRAPLDKVVVLIIRLIAVLMLIIWAAQVFFNVRLF